MDSLSLCRLDVVERCEPLRDSFGVEGRRSLRLNLWPPPPPLSLPSFTEEADLTEGALGRSVLALEPKNDVLVCEAEEGVAAMMIGDGGTDVDEGFAVVAVVLLLVVVVFAGGSSFPPAAPALILGARLCTLLGAWLGGRVDGALPEQVPQSLSDAVGDATAFCCC
jgi:hypothetical protein